MTEVLSAYARALRREAHVLSRSPDLVWQQLHNRLQWEGPVVGERLARERRRRSHTAVAPWFWIHSPLSESPQLIGSLAGSTPEHQFAFSPDGSRLLAVGGGLVQFWEARTGMPTKSLELRGPQGRVMTAHGCVVSPDGSFVVTATSDAVALFDLRTGAQISALEGSSPQLPDDTDPLTRSRLLKTEVEGGPIRLGCSVSPDASFVAGRDGGGAMTIWEVATGRRTNSIPIGSDLATACAVSPDGSFVVFAGANGTVHLWQPTVGTHHELGAVAGGERLERSLVALTDDDAEDLSKAMSRAQVEVELEEARHVWDLRVGPDASYAVAVSGERITVWDLPTGVGRWSREHYGSGRCCSVSPDGRFIVSGGERRVLRIWDSRTGDVLTTLAGHTGGVHACTISPDGALIVSEADDGVRLWSAEVGGGWESLDGHNGRVTSCAFAGDGRHVASTGADNRMVLWATDSHEVVRSFEGHDDVIQDCAFTPDGSQILTAGRDGTARLWEAETGRQVRQFSCGDSVWGCAVHPDGTSALLCSGVSPTSWDLGTGDHLSEYQSHKGQVWRCAYSPEGSWAVTTSEDGTLKIWDTASATERATLTGHDGLVSVCAVSPDGTFIVSGGSDATLRVWGTEDHEQRHVLTGHQGPVWGCSVSADARYVVSTSWDKTLRVWDVETGREQMRLEFPVELHGATFHPSRILAAFGDVTGWVHLVEPMGLETAPVVVTARESDGALSLRCPSCGQVRPMTERNLGELTSCACGLGIRVTSSPLRPRPHSGSGEVARRRRVAELLGEPTPRDRQLTFSLKTCSGCGNEFELLRYACPRCGSMAAAPPSQEALEFMQMRQKRVSGHVDRGSLLFKAGRLDEAEGEFRRAIDANPWNATAYGNLGVVMLHRDQPDDALEWFEKALEIDPAVPGVKEMVSKMRAERPRRKTSRQPDQISVDEEVARAQAAMSAQDWGSAIGHYGAAIQQAKRGRISATTPLFMMYGERATAQAYRGDYRSSLADLDQALELQPAEPHYLDARGRAHYHLDHYQAAVDDFTCALPLLPRSGDWRTGVLMYRAVAHRELGERDSALQDLRIAAQVCEDDTLRQTIEEVRRDLLADGGPG